jgi:hypothetical protein
MIPTPCPRFSIRTVARVRMDHDASGFVPKYFLQTKPETIDLIIPLVPGLVSMVQVERLYLTQKMIKCRGTVS